MSSLPIEANVSELIDSNHQWNEILINLNFAKEDAQCMKESHYQELFKKMS